MKLTHPLPSALAPVALVVGLAASTPALAQPVNLGFEDGAQDGLPIGWTVVAAANEIKVVDTETSPEFQVYDANNFNVVVQPFRGDAIPPDLMLRLNVPEVPGDQNNNVQDGSTAVAQRFTASGSEILIAVRTFVTEFRRNRDFLTIDLVPQSGDGPNFTVTDGDTPLNLNVPFDLGLPGQSCSQTPCNLQLKVKKNGVLFDSGWLKLRISGLQEGNVYDIHYDLTNAGGHSHPSWVYFDDVNRPPVAEYSHSPDPEIPEGEFGFYLNESFDPDGDPLTSEWTFECPGFSPTTSNEESPVFVCPDDGPATVTLEVSDGQASDSITKSVPIANLPPKAVCYDLEVLAGRVDDVLCRVGDPGFLDTITSNVTLDGSPLAHLLECENDPALVTCELRAVVDATSLSAGAILPGTAQFSDGAAGFSALFEVRVVDGPLAEPNDVCDGSVTVNAGKFVLEVDETDVIGTSKDIECIQILGTSDNGDIRVEISNLSGDYDLMLVGENVSGTISVEATPYSTSPYNFSPYNFSPYNFSPYNFSPYLPSELLTSPYNFSPYNFSPYNFSPYNFSPATQSAWESSLSLTDLVPLKHLHGTGLGGANAVTPKDIGVDELGDLSALGDNLGVLAFSALPAGDEAVLTTQHPGTGAVFLAVIPAEGTSTGFLTASIETSQEPPLDEILGANCAGTPVVPPASATATQQLLFEDPAFRTVILTPPIARWAALRGIDTSVWQNEVQPAMEAYCDSPLVGGCKAIALPSTIYDLADTEICNLDAWDAIPDHARGIVATERTANPSVETVIVIGADRDFPLKSIVDLAHIGHESNFPTYALLRVGPTSVRAVQGRYGTDQHLCGNSLLYQNSDWWVPDCTAARIGETWQETRDAFQTFLSSGGEIQLDTAITFGFDFLVDGCVEAADAVDLVTATAADRQCNDTWSASDLRCEAFGDGTAPQCLVHDLTLVNGHATPSLMQSALGFALSDPSDVAISTEIPSDLPTNLLTVGCHFGLPVQDGDGLSIEAGFPYDTAVDWSQRGNGAGVVGIAPIGYGYGFDPGLKGHEKLLVDYLGCVSDGATVGGCFQQAIQSHVLQNPAPDEYVVKVTQGVGLFGPPHYRFSAAAEASAAAASAATSASASSSVLSEEPCGTFTLTVQDGVSTSTRSLTCTKLTSSDGMWFAADGRFDAPVFRALQPIATQEVSPPDADGVMIRGGLVRTTGIDPQIQTPSCEWCTTTEAEVCHPQFSPSQAASLNTLPIEGGFRQELFVTLGQYRCEDPLQFTGTERRFEQLALELTRCESEDSSPPIYRGQSMSVIDEATGTVALTLDFEDESGICETSHIVEEDDGTLNTFSTLVSGPGPFTTVLSGALGKPIFSQVQDCACNVSTITFKGLIAQAIAVRVPNGLHTPGVETDIVCEASGADELVEPTIVLDFGDGTPVFDSPLLDANGNPLPFVELVDDVLRATVPHTYSATAPDPATVTCRISDPFFGTGSGEGEFRACSDPLGDVGIASPNSDIIGCGFALDGTTVSADVFLAGVVDDRNFSYRLFVAPEGQSKTQIKFHKRKVTASIPVTLVRLGSDGIRFVFDATDLGWDGVSDLESSWDTQAGVKKGTTQGHIDQAPDVGSFSLGP